ncbi:MAG: hypothetical protein JRH11_03015 [Deltaproteobacteria bacterium]|nr:hypothetical protein [Deltaproteobacteria bacterium]
MTLLGPLTLALVLVSACSLDTSATVPPGPLDSGQPADGGPGDSAVTGDTGPADSGTTDTGVLDSAVRDGDVMDAGPVDSGTPDTGPADTGPAPTCADHFAGTVPGYTHCGGDPAVGCRFGFADSTLRNCIRYCSNVGFRCADQHSRGVNACDRFISDSCDTDRFLGVCDCVP